MSAFYHSLSFLFRFIKTKYRIPPGHAQHIKASCFHNKIRKNGGLSVHALIAAKKHLLHTNKTSCCRFAYSAAGSFLFFLFIAIQSRPA